MNSRSRYRNGLNTPDQALSKSKRGGGATRRRLLQRNLFYETLEPRQLLAVLGTDSSTTVAVQSGNWSDSSTWDNGVPNTNTRALIQQGINVVLDGSVHVAKELVILGSLQATEERAGDSTGATTLNTDWIHVNSGGLLQVGTEDNRFDQREFIITLTGVDLQADHVIETAAGNMNVRDNDGFLMTSMGGRLQLFGKEKMSFTKLAATAEAGSKSIVVENVIERNFDGMTSAASDGELNWEVGDEIVIASSSYDYNDEEVRTILAVEKAGSETVLTLDAVLEKRHFGEIETYGNDSRTWDIDLRAEVALLSRTITIQGTQDTDNHFGDRANYGIESEQNLGVGAHAMFMPGSGQITIDGARFDKMGQTAKVGRYPVHWHVGGDRTGDILRNSSITNSNNRGVTIHGTQGVLVEGNVLHDIHGHGFFMEDAAETNNRFLHNITFGIHKVGGGFAPNDPFVVPGIVRGGDGKVNGEAPQDGNGESSHDSGQNAPQRFMHSAAYWITNPKNTWIGNISAGSEGTGFWFALPDEVLGLSRDTGLYDDLNPRVTNLLQFDYNTAHSGQVGLTFDRGEDISGGPQNNGYAPPQLMQSNFFTGYKNHGTAVYHRGPDAIFNESRFADNAFSSFNTFGQQERNVLFVGHSRGNAEPAITVGGYRLYDGPGKIVNSHFAGFTSDNAHSFRVEGGANKHTHTTAQGITFENDGTADRLGIEIYGNNFISLDQAPAFIAGRPDSFSGLLFDVDGSLTGHGGGGAGYVLTPKIDFYRDSTDITPPGWNGYLSDDRFAQLRLGRIKTADTVENRMPPFKISNGDGHSIIADRWNGLSHVQRLYVKLNAGDYTIEFLNGIPDDGFDINLDVRQISQPGDSTIFRFVDVGKGYKPTQGAEATSLLALRNSGGNAWFREASGDLWIKVFESPDIIQVQPTMPFIVANTNDSGVGSLRAAMKAANTNPGIDTIVFDVGKGGSTYTIQPQTLLPTITEGVYIDGTTQASLPVLEGGFETPVQPANRWELANGSGAGDLSGSQWAYTGGAGITRNLSQFQRSRFPVSTGFVQAPEGQQHALIQGTGSITQTVTGFEVGRAYDFSLLAMARQDESLGGSLRVALDSDESTENVILDIPEVNYTRFTEVRSTPFVATKNSYTLKIESDSDIGTTFFDDVQFHIVDPPISINGSLTGAEGIEFTVAAVSTQPLWSISATSPTIAEDAAGTESTIVSLTGVVGQGAQASVQVNLRDLTTSTGDYQNPDSAVVQAVNAYSGPGSLSFFGGVLTYTGGAGGTSMADLLVPIQPVDDAYFESTESFEVFLTNPAGAMLDAAQSTATIDILDNDGELPPIPIVQRTTDEIELVDELTEEFLGNSFELDFYRNNAYAAGLTGNYTFLVMNPAGNPDAEAPLWVYLHGGGVGYYDDTGTYVAVKNQTEDTWNHEETFTGLWENHVLAKTFNENTGQPIDSTLKRRIDEGYRVMVVSLSDHDLYSGLGTSYTNSPNPGAEVNGLQATMAAIDYAVANYGTTHVWAHGTSAGSIGVWSLASSYTAEGTPLTGIVADSWIVTPRLYITADAFTGEPGYPFGAGFDVDGVTDKVGFYTDPDNRSEPEAQISDRDFREVPSLFISGNDDPFFGGNQAPLAEAVAEGLTNGQWYHDGLKQAIDNQPNSPHEYHNFFGYGHVPTNREGPVNDTVDEFLSKILTGNPAPPEWSIATTSPTIAEDALANEMLILSLAGTVGEGDQAQVRLDMQDITTSPGDYQDVGIIITQAVDAYNGPGTLAFSNGVLTYKGGVGGSSMNDLSVPILLVNDDLVEENESFVVSLLDMTGDPIGQSQTITIIDDDRSESVWTNLSNRFDVNNDGIITPIDVLNVINYLHVNGSAELPDSRNEGQPFYDVSKDGWISPVDAIQIINEINGFNYTVTIGVQATAANGDVMSEVEVGSIFYLTLTAEDHRDDAKGVYAAYADAYYDPNLIAVVGAPQFIDPYINVKHSDLGTTGLIDEWGAVAGGEPTGSGTNVVSRVPLRAIAAGQVLFGAAAVDDQILRAIAVYGSDDAVPTSEINYQAFNLKITDGEGEDAEGEAYFAEPLQFTVESNNIQAPAWLTPLLIDDVLRTNTESNWLDSRNGLASELESELNSGEDWLETIDDWFARDEEAA